MSGALLIISTLLIAVQSVDPDYGKNMEEIVIARGYPIEKHFVPTEDGYILGMYRIPHGVKRKGLSSKRRPAVYLQHGLESSSYDFVSNFANESLGFVLADTGFDVWFGNSRGNAYSLQHKTHSVDSYEFWDFTYDDMGMYDLPAQVDYVLEQTGQETLSYLGHSQGSTQAWIALGLDSVGSPLSKAAKGLSAKINLFIALAPVWTVHNIPEPVLQLVAPVMADLRLPELVDLLGYRNFLPRQGLIDQILQIACKVVSSPICNVAAPLIFGADKHLNTTRFPVYFDQFPSGTSVKNMAHWAQNVVNEKFQLYDYGCNMLYCANSVHYGQNSPPVIDVSKISVPIALISGSIDGLADITDVQSLTDALPESSVVYAKQVQTFGHLDLIVGVDANKEVWPEIISLLEKYNNMTI